MMTLRTGSGGETGVGEKFPPWVLARHRGHVSLVALPSRLRLCSESKLSVVRTGIVKKDFSVTT